LPTTHGLIRSTTSTEAITMTDLRKHVMQMLSSAQPAGLTPATVGEVVVQPPLSIGTNSQLDATEWMPPGGAEKLRLLRQRDEDQHRLIPESETVREASMKRVALADARNKLTAHPQEFGRGLSPDDPRVIAAQRLLDKATADHERLKQLQEVRASAWRAASQAKAACEAWLRDGRPHSTALEDYEGEPPKLLKNETVLDAIERLRRRGRELRADAHRIASAPYPSTFCKQLMRAEIDELAMRGEPSMALLVEHGRREVAWPMQRLTSQVYAEQRALAFAEVPDVLALICWLHKDALIAALDREIDAESDDKAALSHEARQKAEAEVMGDLLAVERDESALVWQAQAQGLPCEHRADCSPLAILQLRLITAPRADAPGTSAGHAWDITFGGRR
jgi:hypothetical protein